MSTTADRQNRPGDLGRRIAHRRRALGLSREQLASRTGMAPEYLDYVERYHAHLNAASLLSLSIALETTVDTLLGIGVDEPSGHVRGHHAARPRFRPLEAGECMRLLSGGGIGRLVFVDEHGPEAIPVNFQLYEGAIFFRTAADTALARQVGHLVGFEVDHLDDALRQGWSVLLSGHARHVTNPAVIARIHATVEPWAGPGRHVYVQIDPHRITGRRIDA